MRWREFPVLPEDDPWFEEFRIGLGDDPARVLAYLVGRRDSPEVDRSVATRLAVRVGTGLGREATVEALSTVEDRGLVRTTTVSRDSRGRPPKGWFVGDGDLSRRVRVQHSRRLLDRVAEVATHFGTGAVSDPPEGFRTTAEAPPVTGDGKSAWEGEPTELRVVLNWVPNGLHAPLFAAADSTGTGGYRDEGLAVDFETARGSGAAVERLGSDTAEVAVIGAASLCRADRELVPLALLRRRSMAVLYTTTDLLGEPFTSVEQLRGRRLATAPDSEVGRLARLFLARTGVLEEVEIVTTRGEERDALLAGEADAATGMPSDACEFAAAGRDVSSLAVANHFPVPGPALATTAPAATRDTGALVRFLIGTLAGVAATRRDPGRVASVVAERSGDDVANERWRLERAFNRNLDWPAARDHGWGWQSIEDWERLQAALRQEVDG